MSNEIDISIEDRPDADETKAYSDFEQKLREKYRITEDEPLTPRLKDLVLRLRELSDD
ncbi:MAG: hypothetical protein AAGJ68_15380 [Pseudomonadota bacterium]